jgi:hypothetical protein
VGGSLASSLHGIPRSTQDADVVADMKPIHIEPFVKALESEFYVDADMIREAVNKRSSFNVIHLETMFKVDVFLLGEDDVSQEEMARRKRFQVSEEPGGELFLASAEDVILQKLHWFRLGKAVSERQWNDALGVLQVQGKSLDFSYLRRCATTMGILALLEQALEEAGIKESGG